MKTLESYPSLSDCQPQQTARIVALMGELDTKLRLVNLGFHTKSLVKVLLKRHQSLIISVDGSRFALDEKLAQLIKVDLLS